MSFYDQIKKHESDFEYFTKELNKAGSISNDEIHRILGKTSLADHDFFKLLHYSDTKILEKAALRAREESLNHFGKTILLYSPMYISNICVNRCVYCSFNNENKMIDRVKLNINQIKEESIALSKTGIKHVLVLTGEEKKERGYEYVLEAVKVIREYFESVSIEVAPLDEDHYISLVDGGVDGVTIYQEVYDEEVYKTVHLKGPKSDFRYRLETPERACNANIRSMNIGTLIGLSDYKRELYIMGMHLKYLSDKYPHIDLGISLPRIKDIDTSEEIGYTHYPITDAKFVQCMIALRLFLPHCAVNISTRESSEFRRNLIPIGVNKMSAGVSTSVGGYSVYKDTLGQFNISDTSSVEDVKDLIKSVGYQPILKDWMKI